MTDTCICGARLGPHTTHRREECDRMATAGPEALATAVQEARQDYERAREVIVVRATIPTPADMQPLLAARRRLAKLEFIQYRMGGATPEFPRQPVSVPETCQVIANEAYTASLRVEADAVPTLEEAIAFFEAVCWRREQPPMSPYRQAKCLHVLLTAAKQYQLVETARIK